MKKNKLEDMLETLKNITTAIVFIASLLAFMFLIVYLSDKYQDEMFNNGICKECGGTYVYLQAVGHRDKTGFLYECDQCGNVIEIDKKR